MSASSKDWRAKNQATSRRVPKAPQKTSIPYLHQSTVAEHVLTSFVFWVQNEQVYSPWRILTVLLYMVCHGSHQYTPFMLAYIPAPAGSVMGSRRHSLNCDGCSPPARSSNVVFFRHQGPLAGWRTAAHPPSNTWKINKNHRLNLPTMGCIGNQV